MIIAINATAAFKQPRTGVEEYTYQLLKHLAGLSEAQKHHFLLYTPQAQELGFNLPENFEIKELKFDLGFFKKPLPMWTQVRLAVALAQQKPDSLLIPVHVLPFLRPQNSVVVIHGLEYEYYPQMYPFRHLKYLRASTKYAAKKAKKIITVSENTKKDLIDFYGIDSEKIKVVYHGLSQPQAMTKIDSSAEISPYFLYLGRLELKKNIEGLLKAFQFLKKEKKLPHKLVLAGPAGYGYKKILSQIRECQDVFRLSYVSESNKWWLLKNASVFCLPSFYEGFGLPVLEAQMMETPVVTSNISSMPEVAGQGALLIDPNKTEEIAEALGEAVSNDDLKEGLIQKGLKNVERFSWSKCAKETLDILER